MHVGQVREGRTYSAAVARGVVASLADEELRSLKKTATRRHDAAVKHDRVR